jgi:hypothetical protein
LEEDDILEAHQLRTIMMEDKFLTMKLKRQSMNRQAQIGWNHTIYVINKSKVTKSKLAEQKYVIMKNASSKKLKKIAAYLPAKKFPKSFTFKEIKTIVKIKISSGHSVNGDLFL